MTERPSASPFLPQFLHLRRAAGTLSGGSVRHSRSAAPGRGQGAAIPPRATGAGTGLRVAGMVGAGLERTVHSLLPFARHDRKCVVWEQIVSERVGYGGRGIIKKQK